MTDELTRGVGTPGSGADAPLLVVVGHPNKGKSSIVATLAEDASVKIAPRPGTTVRADHFPMRVDGRLLYTLVDTPGFENARRALDWMRRHDEGVDRRNEVVRKFITGHRGDAELRNEVELLTPLVADGGQAGVLYVVDGSIPFSEEYEAEMEILRWAGRPRMALINQIGSADYTGSWRTALDQYFSIVREFNAVTAPFEKHLELLRGFGELREGWAAPMRDAAEALADQRAGYRRRSAELIAGLLADMLTLTESKVLSREEEATPHKEALQGKLRGRLRQLERRCRQEVESVYGHDRLERVEGDVESQALLEGDLFSEHAWVLFGLRKKHWVLAGVAGGAATGGVIDASVGAVSFMAGAVVGAIVGGGLGWYSAGRVAKIPTKSRWLPSPLRGAIGGKKLTCGPIRNVNFPFVVLGRARHHHGLIADRNHAAQGVLKVEYQEEDAGRLNPLTGEETRTLSRLFTKLGKCRPDSEQVQPLLDQLADRIAALLG
ncbi:MAG: GTPase/DUF3482 domain-containing protein [Phycisphaerales bacterium JB063]